MGGTVKGATKVGIDDRVARLRLQLVASDLTRRIGRRIRDRRVELSLTQKQVAQRMTTPDVDKQRISDWERGYNKPSERYLQELVAALEVPDISYFYEQTEQPAETPDPFVPNGNGIMALLDERLAAIEDRLEALRLETEARDLEVLRRLDEGLGPSAASQ